MLLHCNFECWCSVGVSGRTEDSRKSPGVERKSPLDRKMSPGSSAGDRERKSPAVDIFGKNRSTLISVQILYLIVAV